MTTGVFILWLVVLISISVLIGTYMALADTLAKRIYGGFVWVLLVSFSFTIHKTEEKVCLYEYRYMWPQDKRIKAKPELTYSFAVKNFMGHCAAITDDLKDVKKRTTLLRELPATEANTNLLYAEMGKLEEQRK